MSAPPDRPLDGDARSVHGNLVPGPLQGGVEIGTLPVTRAFLSDKRLLRLELAVSRAGERAEVILEEGHPTTSIS